MFRSELKKRLETLKEKYQGKSAIIFGNGPSVSNINIKLIKENKNIITLTTNQIAPICKKNDWYPDLYTAFFCEPLRGKKYKMFLRKPINYQGSYKKALLAQKDVKYMVENKYTECFINDWFEKFLGEVYRTHLIKPVLWDRFVDFPKNAFFNFQIPNKFLWNCATTPLFQLCFYFKFKNIAIIGQDGYEINSKNHYENYKGNEHNTESKMLCANHRINKLMDAVSYYANEFNIQISNLSSISKFDQFQKLELEKFLENV